MKNSFLLSALLVLAVAFGSCKKDDNPSNTEKLTGGNRKWKITAYTISPAINVNGTQVTDLYANVYQDCDRDDLFIFSSNGTFTWDEGTSKCQNGANQVVATGTWTWASDEKILRISMTPTGSTTPVVREYTIDNLSTSELKAHYTEISNGISFVNTQTFKP